MIWHICLVAIGGFFGAISRYFIGEFFVRRCSTSFPYGTLTVNLLGSFALGLIFGMQANDVYLLLLGIGFLGAFTTFSALNVEIINLAGQKHWVSLAIYIGTTYIIGIFAASLGFIMGT